MIYSDILSSIKTTEHARELIFEIDILLSTLFRAQNQSFEQALGLIRVNTANYLRESLMLSEAPYRLVQGEVEALNDRDKINNFLIALKEKLQAQKILKISLSFEASENSIDNLFNWVLKNLGNGIVLDIKTDKAILGGAIIEFEGRYKDLTLKKKLEEAFGSKREEIMTPYQYQKSNIKY